MTFAEGQRDPVTALRHRKGVREMSPSLAGVQRRVGRDGGTLLRGISRADQRISSHKVGVAPPFLSGGIAPRGGPPRPDSDGPDLAALTGSTSIAFSIAEPRTGAKAKCRKPSAAGEISRKTLSSAMLAPAASATMSKKFSSSLPLADTRNTRCPSPLDSALMKSAKPVSAK